MEIILYSALSLQIFHFYVKFFPINLRVTAICQLPRLFVIIIHLFLCITGICKDIILKET
jgi:hypothetical protein